MKYFKLLFLLLLLYPSASFADVVYEQTSTTTIRTSTEMSVDIICDNVQTNIDSVTIYTRWLVSGKTVTFFIDDFAIIATSTVTETNNSYKTFVVDPPIPCYTGTSTFKWKSSDLNTLTFRAIGTTGSYDSVQASSTVYGTNGTYNNGTLTRLALSISGTDTPPPPELFRDVTPPPPLETGLLYRTSTTTCNIAPSSSECVTQYVPEIYYLDWLLVNIFIIFLLSFTAIGFFMSRTLNK